MPTPVSKQNPSQGESRAFAQQLHNNIQAELAAYQRMLPELLRTYNGAFVAICGGKVIDTDENEFSLVDRVTREHKDTFVFIQRVTESAEPTSLRLCTELPEETFA